LTEQVSTLNTSVSNLTSENTSLKKKVSSLEDDVDDLEDDNKDLKSTNKDLESKNSTLSSQVSSLNSDVSDLKNTNSSLQTQVSDLNSKNGTLSTQVSDLTSKNSSLTTEVSDLKSQKTTTSASTGTTSTSSTNKNTTSTSSASTKSSTSTKTTSTDDEDEDDLEGSTSKIDTKADANKLNADLQPEAITTDIVSTGTDSVKLGTTKEVSMFSDAQITSVAAGQYAKGSVIKFSDSNPIVKISDSNGKGVNDISTESLDNVYKIMNYYANHVEELGNLGSDDVVNAAANESKDVVLDVVAAGDILPSATQESAFNLNQSAKLNVSFPNITNGALYLVVHERADQAGQYEVCLTTAASDSVSMNVSSLSPVVVAKVQIKDAESTVNSTLTDNAVDTLETPAEENSNKNGVGTIFVILFIIIVFAVGLVCLFMKLKKDGRLPEFLSFT
jgi:FtsZ-binding cell division protein ZapB